MSDQSSARDVRRIAVDRHDGPATAATAPPALASLQFVDLGAGAVGATCDPNDPDCAAGEDGEDGAGVALPASATGA